MNFDMNTLSTLMQFMSAQKPKTAQTAYNDASGYERENAADNGAPNMRGGYTASVFAMQNGLGQRVEFEEKKQTRSTSSSAQNPMSSLLEMMTGKSVGGNGDMMSSLMPMLFNMMGGKGAQTAQTANNNTAANGKNDQNSGKNTTAPNDQSGNKENERKVEDDPDKKKTQPRDKYQPISFAGYTLISALNRLYMSKKRF